MTGANFLRRYDRALTGQSEWGHCPGVQTRSGTTLVPRTVVRVFKAGNDQVIRLRMRQNHLVTVEREEDLVGLQRVGLLAGLTLDLMTRSLEPGITTSELDRAARD
jgi:hypothetical protein